MVHALPHTLVAGHVMDVSEQPVDGSLRIQVVNNNNTSQYLTARNVILAMGTVGKPVVPRGFNLESPSVFCWKDPRAYQHTNEAAATSINTQQQQQRVLVVGGGLTAVQVALRVVNDGHDCVLCSRRPLMERHFDIPVKWFDSRSTNKCLSDFYHYSIDQRLQQLKQARDGGSIPPMYLSRIEQVCNRSSSTSGQLRCWVGHVECIPHVDEEETKESQTIVTVIHDGMKHVFDKVILSCGVQPACQENALIRNVLEKWPIAIHGGLPAVTQDLRWKDGCNILLAGALAALQVGPDAGNLMGIRRAAVLIANSLNCRGWLHEQTLANPFDALMWDDSDSDTDSDTETPA